MAIPRHVERFIRAQAQRSADGNETGGVLLGFGDSNRHWVTGAGDPGPRAERTPVHFRRDLEHAERLAERAFLLDGSQWIGDWHTHPCGPPQLSAKDLRSYRRVLANSDLDEFLALLLVPGPVGWDAAAMSAWNVTAGEVARLAVDDPLPRND